MSRPYPMLRAGIDPGQDADTGKWEPGSQRSENSELYRGILYEPPYSIRDAAVGFTVTVIGSLVSQWLWGQ